MHQIPFLLQTKVAGKHQPVTLRNAAADIQLGDGGAEDVSGIVEGERNARTDFGGRVQMHGPHQLHERFDVALLIERLEEVLALRAAFLVDVFQVAFPMNIQD